MARDGVTMGNLDSLPMQDTDSAGKANDVVLFERLDHSIGDTAAATGAAVVEELGDDFVMIVERYSAALISFLFGMVGDREQAEDLAQDTFIKAFEALERRRTGQQFTSGWLFRIARNTALDALRRKRLIAWLPFAPEHERALPVPNDLAGQLADRELIQSILQLLPARYREVLLLRTAVGLSNKEIATALGTSTGNVNTLLFRARERFRQVYEQVTATDRIAHTAAQIALERQGSE